MSRQQRQQVEFLGPQVHSFGAVSHLVTVDVDLELARADELGLVRFSACAAQESLRTRDELLWMERLGQVVIGADLEADDLVGDLVAGGQHDDRDLALLADLLADGEAVDSRQHNVEDHQVRLQLAEPGHGLRPVPHPLDLVALACQVQARQLNDVLLIIDDHDPRAHRSAHSVN